jgi:hypothetical protein
VHAEREVHGLMRTQRHALAIAEPPPALRHRCSALHVARPFFAAQWRALAVAASLLLVAGVFLYQASEHSTRVMAASLTADHVKCFRVNSVLGTHEEPSAVEDSMASYFDWPVRLPEHPERADLVLVGGRPCVYPQGMAAHIMYLHHGHPVSLFMLPQGVREEELMDVMGHRAAIWSSGNRTFVLIADEPRDEVERLISFVHAGMR